MAKSLLNATATKTMFLKRVAGILQAAVDKSPNADRLQNLFVVEGSSIMCNIPDDFFELYEIPANTKIEMKFVTKKA